LTPDPTDQIQSSSSNRLDATTTSPESGVPHRPTRARCRAMEKRDQVCEHEGRDPGPLRGRHRIVDAGVIADNILEPRDRDCLDE
jgi:hypothetical protein